MPKKGKPFKMGRFKRVVESNSKKTYTVTEFIFAEDLEQAEEKLSFEIASLSNKDYFEAYSKLEF